MSDFDDRVPLDGKKIRVWGSLIQQALDHMALTKSDYVTLVVVGDTCVSVHTGKTVATRPSPKLLIEEPREPRVQRAGRVHQKKKRPYKRGGVYNARIVDVETLIGLFEQNPNVAFNAKEVGDHMEFDRKDLSSRGGITRALTELRLSGFIKATSDSRVPSYTFGTRVESVDGMDVSEASILMVLQKAKRPLAYAVIGDLLNIPRNDPDKRLLLQRTAHNMVMDHRLARDDSNPSRISLYTLP